MSDKKIVSLRFDDEFMDRLQEIQNTIFEATGDKLGYSKIIILYIDLVEGNLDSNTILLHYSMIKDNLLADGRKKRWEKLQV